MRLTFSTDYTLRLWTLVGLESERLVTIEEVADRFGISKNHLMKVAYQLGQAGFLETVRGHNGGLRLGKAPSQIVVGKSSAKWNQPCGTRPQQSLRQSDRMRCLGCRSLTD